MVDAVGQFLLVVGHHNERFVLSVAEGLDYLFHALAVGLVEAVQGFVEDEQFGVLHQGSGKEHKALLAAGELEEACGGKVADAKYLHPEEAGGVVARVGLDV